MSKRIKEGFTDEASRAEQDHEVQMARSDLYKLAEYSIKLHELLKNVSEQEGLQGWVQSKITKASDYIGSVYHHMEYKQQRQQAGGIPVAETKRTKMPAKRLKESTEVAELGRTMMDMATTEKDDDVSNQLSILGDTLTQFGTVLGPKNVKDVVKQTGLDQNTIQQYMAAAQKRQAAGVVRKGGAEPEGDEFENYNENIKKKFSGQLKKKLGENKKSTRKGLKESTEVAELGRTMMDMATTEKDDDVSNQLSILGDTLTQFGTVLGPKNVKEVVKQTGMDPNTIQKYMAAAQKQQQSKGVVRTGRAEPESDEDKYEGSVREEGEPNTKRLWMQINKYEQQAKKTKSPIKKDHFMKMANELRAKLPTDEDS